MTKRKDRGRVYSILDSREKHHDFGGPWFLFIPDRDPVAWDALKFYMEHTDNVAQRQALYNWFKEHSRPGEPEPEQMEMGL